MASKRQKSGNQPGAPGLTAEQRAFYRLDNSIRIPDATEHTFSFLMEEIVADVASIKMEPNESVINPYDTSKKVPTDSVYTYNPKPQL